MLDLQLFQMYRRFSIREKPEWADKRPLPC